MTDGPFKVVPFRRPEAEPLTWSGEIFRSPGARGGIATPEPGGGDLNRPRPNWSRSDLIRFALPVTVVFSSRHGLDRAPRFGVFATIKTGVIVSILALLLWGDLLYSYHYALCEMFTFFIVS
jgi:hypothetical protein